MKRAGYEKAKELMAQGWTLLGQQGSNCYGRQSTYARLVAPGADGYYTEDNLISITWGLYKKLTGEKQ